MSAAQVIAMLRMNPIFAGISVRDLYLAKNARDLASLREDNQFHSQTNLVTEIAVDTQQEFVMPCNEKDHFYLVFILQLLWLVIHLLFIGGGFMWVLIHGMI